MKSVRWAVVGAGGIARRRTIPEGIEPAENAELVAVYAPESGGEVAAEFGVEFADSEESLYTHPWDALYVASPVNLHLAQVLRAAEAKRHVLCEKPLARTVSEAEQMVQACDKVGVLLGVGFMMRGHPLHEKARDLVQSHSIGQPTYVRAQLSCWYPPIEGAWRQNPTKSGGGALPDLATHCIDLLETILRQRVKSVSCILNNLVHEYAVEDTAVLTLEFEGNTVGTIDCLFNVPDEAVPNRLEIYGSAGSILAEGTIGQTDSGTLRWFESSQMGYDSRQQRSSEHGWHTATMSPSNLFRTQIEGFSSAVLQNQPPPVPGTQGLWIQKVVESCQKSATTGNRVRVQ